MEMIEMRYFLAVARAENIHKAAGELHISPGALSKAVSRLESELGVGLFSREGRGIRLTDHGRLLQRRASEIVHLEESSRTEISGHRGTIHVVIAGPEILLSNFAVQVTRDIARKFPVSTFEYHAGSDERAIEEVVRGEAHLALTSGDVSGGLEGKVMGETTFLTCVGAKHPLAPWAREKKPVTIERLLEHAFVSPNRRLLGVVGAKQSMDGWRDDKFPRRIGFLASSLKLMEELVVEGQAVAYLPDYYARQIDVLPLKVRLPLLLQPENQARDEEPARNRLDQPDFLRLNPRPGSR